MTNGNTDYIWKEYEVKEGKIVKKESKESKKSELPSPTVLKFSKAERYDN